MKYYYITVLTNDSDINAEYYFRTGKNVEGRFNVQERLFDSFNLPCIKVNRGQYTFINRLISIGANLLISEIAKDMVPELVIKRFNQEK